MLENKEKRLWAEFLKKSCTDLHNQKIVISSARKSPAINQNMSYQRIVAYIDRLEKLFSNDEYDEKTYERLRKNIFELICEQIIIKPEDIKEEIYINQKKAFYDRYGSEAVFPDDFQNQKQRQIIENQRNSLKVWYDYLCSKENGDVSYPAWFRFYAFTGATTVGTFDKRTKNFIKRDKYTTVIFPELDREALSLMYGLLKDYIIDNKEVNEQYRNLINIAKQYSFRKLYSAILNHLDEKRKETSVDSYEGIWKKYNQDGTGKEAERLVDDIKNYRTGWCTAGIETAKGQLKDGDFYIYYIINKETNELIPKIAIRMEDGEVAEVRGTDEDQNIYDPRLLDIAKEKYIMLPGGKAYEKKEKNVKKLIEIYAKQYVFDKEKNMYMGRVDKEELTRDDLLFLYQTEERFVGFGYGSDKRIRQLLDDRNILIDLSIMKIDYFPRHLPLGDIYGLEPDVLPKVIDGEIQGDIHLNSLTELHPGLLPEKCEGIRGLLSLNRLRTLQPGLLPEKIKTLSLNKLEELRPGCLPAYYVGVLSLNSLKILYSGCLPEEVEYLYLDGLVELHPGSLPKGMVRVLSLNGLKTLYPGSLPKSVEDLYLNGIEELQPESLPPNVAGLYLNNLKILNPECLSQKILELHIESVTQIMSGYLPKGFKCGKIYANLDIKRQLEQLMKESENYYKQFEEENITKNI